MNTCKTCSLWTSEAPYNRPESFVSRRCASEKFDEEFYKEEADGLYYPYVEGGCFYTGPDFGCVHHRTTDAPANQSRPEEME